MRLLYMIKRLHQRYLPDEILVLALLLSIFISVYLTAVCALGIIIVLVRQRRFMPIIQQTRGGLYPFIACGIGLITSLCYRNWLGLLIAFGIAAVFFLAMYMRTVMTRRLFEKIIHTSCAASMFAFAVALLQYITGWSASPGRVEATFFNTNYYATFIEFILLFSLYAYFNASSKKNKLFYALTIVANLAGFFMTGCRSSWLVIMVSLGLMFLLNRRYKGLACYVGLCSVIAFIIFCIPEVFPRSIMIETDLSDRSSIWLASIKSIASHPLLGQGPAGYMQIYPLYGSYPTYHAHNLLLDPLLNFGLIGTGLFIVYLYGNINATLKMRRMLGDSAKCRLLICVMAAIALHGIFDITILWPQTGLFTGMIFACSGIYEHNTIAVHLHGDPMRYPAISDSLSAGYSAIRVPKKAG